jgi:cobalt/nickel transport system permease protein
MHIPDGYISPTTYTGSFAVMAPISWGVSRHLKKTLKTRQLPMLSLAAAFSFVLMMFNIPIPGGTTGHAVGGVLIAILLGPAAACMTLTLVLVTQALLFGDGGITAIGANAFNMAVVMPFVGYGVYRLLTYRFPSNLRWKAFSAGIAGYVGLNMAALTTAVIFGIQPMMAHDAGGKALYAPYPLSIAIPAVMLPHLLVFGWIEALVTGFAVASLERRSL